MKHDILRLGLATLLGCSACGDGRHFEKEGNDGAGEPGGGRTEPRAEVTGGTLELGEVWGEGMNLEISGLRWSGEGEIELVMGAVDPETHTPIDGLAARPPEFAEDGQDLGSEVYYELSREQNLRVALVLDLSRSMIQSEAVEPLQDAALGLLDAVPSGTRVALVQFATGYDLVQDFTGDMAQLAESVDDLAPQDARRGQFTNLWGSLAYAGSLFDKGLPGEGRVVVVFTDGRDNVAEADAAKARSALTEAGALVYAVGLGEELDRDALKSLAGPGRYAETTRPAALRPIFEDIGQRLGQLVRLRYTTPKITGRHTLSVEVSTEDGRRRGGFTLAFALE